MDALLKVRFDLWLILHIVSINYKANLCRVIQIELGFLFFGPIKSQTFLSSPIYYVDFLIFILSVNSGCPKTFDWQCMSKMEFFF